MKLINYSRQIFKFIREIPKNHSSWFEMTLFVLSVFFSVRIFSSLVLLLGSFQPPSVFPNELFAFQTYQELENSNSFIKYFISPWFRWDTVNYLGIAINGYNNNPLYTVWPPLYPFLIKALSYVLKPPLFAAIIISNLFFISGIVFFVKIISNIFDETVAKSSLLFFILFPTSFYMIAPYTESIYLALSLAVIYFSMKNNWLAAGILSGFAAITRVQGLLLIIPIFFEGMMAYKLRKDKKLIMQFLPATLFAPMTYGIYCLYVRFGLLADWPWASLSKFWGQHFDWPWKGVIGNLSAVLNNYSSTDVTMTSIKLLTVFVTISSIYFCAKTVRRLPISISIYSWAVLILALCKIDDQSLMVSTMRYLLPIFPIFIGQALVINKKWMKSLYFAFGVGVNLAFITFNYWWIWVA